MYGNVCKGRDKYIKPGEADTRYAHSLSLSHPLSKDDLKQDISKLTSGSPQMQAEHFSFPEWFEIDRERSLHLSL